MPARMFDDPWHHFELSPDGKNYKCAHCDASYERQPNDGLFGMGRDATYGVQLHDANHPKHLTTSVIHERCSGKAAEAAKTPTYAGRMAARKGYLEAVGGKE